MDAAPHPPRPEPPRPEPALPEPGTFEPARPEPARAGQVPDRDRVGEIQETAEGELVRTQEIGTRTYVVARVEPLDVDGVRTIAVGTVLWLVAFVVLLPFYGRLRDEGRAWWLWTCLAGFGLGLLGWEYCRRRRRARHARAAGHGRQSAGP